MLSICIACFVLSLLFPIGLLNRPFQYCFPQDVDKSISNAWTISCIVHTLISCPFNKANFSTMSGYLRYKSTTCSKSLEPLDYYQSTLILFQVLIVYSLPRVIHLRLTKQYCLLVKYVQLFVEVQLDFLYLQHIQMHDQF